MQSEKTNIPRNAFNRRDLLKGSALIATGIFAASALPGCVPKNPGSEAGSAVADLEGVNYETYDTDVLIIGGGLCGMNAAQEAIEKGINAIVVEKSTMGHGGAAGMNWYAVISEVQDPATSVKYDIFAGAGLVNQNVAKAVDDCAGKEGGVPRCVNQGTTFLERNADGTLVKKPVANDFSAKGVYTRHGADWLAARGVNVVNNTMITNLLVQDGKCVGAMGIDLLNGVMRVFRSKATISTAGGGAWMNGWVTVSACTINSPDNTGDLDAMALRHGARLHNMELNIYDLIMIYPTGIAYSYNGALGNDPLYKDSVCDADGNFWMREMESPIPRNTYIAEVAKKVRDGKGSEHGGVYVDLRDKDGVPSEEIKKFGKYYARNIDPLREKFGFDIRKDLIEVIVEQADTVGHPVADGSFMTDIPGLFWANPSKLYRQTNNSLFGSVMAMRNAVDYARSDSAPIPGDEVWTALKDEYDRLQSLRTAKVDDPLYPHQIRHAIQAAISKGLGVMKNETDMQVCLDELRRIREEDMPRMALRSDTMVYNTEWKQAIENVNLLDFAEATTVAAMARKESRGVFIRDDYPEKDDENFLCAIGVTMKDGQISAEKFDFDFSVFDRDKVLDIINNPWPSKK